MSSQNHSIQPLGLISKFKATELGLDAVTSGATFSVITYHESIIRISISKDNQPKEFSYSVVASPAPGICQVHDDGNKITLKTSTLILEITKDPARFRFLDQNNQVINEDDPGLGTAWIGEQVTSYKKLQQDERFIGLGEKTGPLNRRGHGYQNWNTDAYGYHPGADPLYCSTPFYIGLHHGMAYGIFLDNTHKSHFNFGASNNRFSSFAADAGEMNYYFLYGKNVAEIIKHYSYLTGTTPIPPVWSIGYQQCRYSYYPDKEVLGIARTFREKEIPSDVIVFDIHYMDKYKIFTWDKKNFPDPKALIEKLNDMGFHVVVMCDPGIKVEEGYEAFEDGVKENVFIKYPDGENYTGQVWPGWCHFPDFTKPAARDWWKSKFKDYVKLGVDGFWNDMNEIATWGNSLPENLIFDFDGNPETTRKGRNVFGFQMARSTYEGTKELLGGKRPFNLTRSGFSGIQRYAAVWTGDNVSYDEHMLLGVRMVSNMGLAGIAFAGYDVGGFVGDANTKLFARWISIGALSPFFRAHTMINTRDSEPWSYGEEVEQIARNYIRFRYQLLPYLYSLFYETSQTGIPIQRSLAIDYSHEDWVYDHQFHNQYLFGPYILVAPVESTKELTKVFLPEGKWYYLYDGKCYEGNQQIMIDCPIHKLPVFVKEGAIIPMTEAKANTQEKCNSLDLHFYKGGQSTSFEWYEDDGITFDYENGKFLKRKLEYHGGDGTVKIGKSNGEFIPGYRKIKLFFHQFEIMDRIVINDNDTHLSTINHSFFSPLEKYDPINDPDSMGEEIVKFVEIEYTADELNIKMK